MSAAPAYPRPANPPRSTSRWLALSLILALTAMAALATPPAMGAAAASDLGPEIVHTGEAPTGYEVTFRYEAPAGVESVSILGEWWFSQPSSVTCQGCGDARTGAEWQPGDILAGPWRTLPMQLGDDGVWTFTTPLPSGTFRYAFVHDCESPTASGCTLHQDPANPIEVTPHEGARGALLSYIYVPESDEYPTYDNDYQAPPARLGTLEQRVYPSPTSTVPPGEHHMVVYLPYGYDPDRATPYPTLYLSHGGSGNQTDWSMEGMAHRILENAIADREAVPMVLVMTNFYDLPGGNEGYANDLRDNVIPFVEENYNVSTSSTDRAFAGLSAGGSRALTLLYDYTSLFEYYGVWSSAGGVTTPSEEQLERLRNVSGAIHMSTGYQDHQSNINENSIARAAMLRAAGVDVVEWNIDGVHVWDVWRQQLNHFLRNVVFQSELRPHEELDRLVVAGDITEGMQARISHALEMFEAWIENPRQRGPALSHLRRAIHLLLWQADVVDRGKPNQGDAEGLRELAATITALLESYED